MNCAVCVGYLVVILRTTDAAFPGLTLNAKICENGNGTTDTQIFRLKVGRSCLADQASFKSVIYPQLEIFL